MENERRSSIDSKDTDNIRRNSKDNTEYVPTRCRITKPTPPKPATNPMQFVKIAPCALFRKAHDQVKKVEEVKAVRQEIRDDAEDWQANLDNWKSSRRKRQEHIIERVVEVKKFEQQEMEKSRRRSKTFNEILEERNKRKNKLSISIYENDDPNDLSDYGIGVGNCSGTAHSDTSSNVVTDDEATSVEVETIRETNSWNDVNDRINNGQRDDQNNTWIKEESQEKSKFVNNSWEMDKKQSIWTEREEQSNIWNKKDDNYTWSDRDLQKEEKQGLWNKKDDNYAWSDKELKKDEKQGLWNKKDDNYTWNDKETQIEEKQSLWNKNDTWMEKKENKWVSNTDELEDAIKQEPQQYTYESAIQGYRTRVKSNLNANGNLSYPLSTPPVEKQDAEANIIVPKGSILKRKELFEGEKLFELNSYESSTSRRLCDDFAHSQSLKERLLSLEKYTEHPLCSPDVRSPDEASCSDRNIDIVESKPVHSRISMLENIRSDFEKAKSNPVINSWSHKGEISDRSSSPETDIFVNKIENFHRSLDNLTDSTNDNMTLERVQSLEGLECCHSTNYPASNSSTELLVLSSQYGDTDREDSGIHTADVSCSVSQADEPVEDSDVSANTNARDKFITDDAQSEPQVTYPMIPLRSPLENVDLPWNNNVYTIDNVFSSEQFPLGPPITALEPPKEKPPPPPVMLPDDDLPDESELKRLNSTKRIKKEMRLKRSSFLGIDPEDQPEVEATLRKPPDINSFLQKESRLEKQLYKKTQGSYSEAGDSQDSGVELERGRLSSDTWCSSLPDCRATPVHGRQDSEPCTTNSITSEEDEITKKEREIIELVEKEEQWRGRNECDFTKSEPPLVHHIHKPEFIEPITPKYEPVPEYIKSEDDDRSEVLRVEHELLQLEREEMERQRENMVFRESRARLQPNNCLKNKRLSLEDISNPMNRQLYMSQRDPVDYRKSMPELQHDVQISNYSPRAQSSGVISRSSHSSPVKNLRPVINDQYDREKFVRKSADHLDSERLYQHESHNKVPRPIARHSLYALGTAPRTRLDAHNSWLQPKHSTSDARNYNQHWLIQEAEQRRLEQQKFISPSIQSWKMTRPEKHLPDSVIQTLTQRVQNKVTLTDRNVLGRRLDNIPNLYNPHSPHSVGHALPLHQPHLMEESQDKMLSVSGKKKCSYCGNELGRGAAMIIESLCLFYHMDCFKCCVCHVQLGDGLMGTDVRVRNNTLHCHNCYSSDDGVKFSCV